MANPIIRHLVLSHRSNDNTNMVVVRPTGGGKSLVYQVAGYLMKGITLFISPLLALASDQIRKLRVITRNRPEFVSLHLDDMEESSLIEVAHDISTWKEPDGAECAISVIIFASPQLLVGSKGIPIMNILLDRNKSILSMTGMDEVHIASQFGNTFRSEFKMLKRKFYSQLPACCSVNIFMTGTCTLAIVHNFETLFGVKINCTHWPKHNDMRHRSVGIILKYTSAPMKEGNRRNNERSLGITITKDYYLFKHARQNCTTRKESRRLPGNR